MDAFQKIAKIEKETIEKKKEHSRQIRSAFAKLMATERIFVEHANVPTASFDLKNRTLHLPVWKDSISDDLYRLMITHEVGHALYTPNDEENLKELMQHPGLKEVINIVEDARIEKMILSKYPGCRKSFPIGYKELFSMKRPNFSYDFSNPDSLKEKELIDRLNLRFKIGNYCNVEIPFTEEEKHWVEEIDSCKTFEDVVSVSKKLFKDWERREEEKRQAEEKAQQEQQEKQRGESEQQASESGESQNDEQGQGEQSESKQSKESSESESSTSTDSEKSEERDGQGEQSKKSASQKSEEKSQNSSKSESFDNEGDDGDSEDSEQEITVMSKDEFNKLRDEMKDNQPTGEAGEAEPIDVEFENPEDNNLPPPPNGSSAPQKPAKKKILVVESQDFLNEITKQLAETSQYALPLYVNLPTELKEEEYVVPYKEVHDQIEQHYKRTPNGEKELQIAAEYFDKFKQATRKVVSNMASIFEMKKRARLYSRSQTSKTGILDLSKIHTYRYNEDVFKKVTTVPDGKCHGLLMFIDLSGSMRQNMRGTYEQTLNLVLFCRKVGIPFEVYGFTDVDSSEQTDYRRLRYTSGRVGDWVFPTNQKLRQYFSSKMKLQEFNRACVNMMALVNAHGQRYSGWLEKHGFNATLPSQESLGGTPLNFAIATSANISKRFREEYDLDIVNIIYLTDGEATDSKFDLAANNTVYGSHGAKTKNGLSVDSNGYYRSNVTVLRDPVTRKEWKVCSDESRDFRPNMTRHYYYRKYDQVTDTLLKIVRETCNVNAICYYVSNSRNGRQFIENIAANYGLDPHEKIKEYNKEGCFFWAEVNGYSNYYMIKDGDDLMVDDGEFEITEEDDTKTIQRKYRKAMEQLVVSRIFLNKFIENIS